MAESVAIGETVEERRSEQGGSARVAGTGFGVGRPAVLGLPVDTTGVEGADVLHDELAAIGYSKVIAVLKREPRPPAPAAAAALSAAPPAGAPADIVTALASHFVVPSEAQASSLAMVAARASGREMSLAASRARSRASAPPAGPRRVRVFPRLGLAIGYVDRAGLEGLQQDGHVEKVVKAPEVSLIRPVASVPTRPGRQMTWGLKRLKVDRLWAAGYHGKGVVVGHLDTGVDGGHPALQGAIAQFAEFDMQAEPVPDAKPRDSGEHGTHTAGTIVGRAGTKGPFGVAPQARLASAMVIEGGLVIDRILAGMEWLVEQDVRILSMSAGLRGYVASFEVIIRALRDNNVLPIIASGNEGPGTSRSPGNYIDVLSAGAIDSNDVVADFSSSQHFARPKDPLVPDLVAPGVGVLSCVPGARYAEMNGTSMAAPHVAGLAALLLEARPNATAAELEKAILASCSLPLGMEPARGNRGVPDAVRAFRLLTRRELPAAMPAAAPKPRRAAASGRRTASVRRRKIRPKQAVKKVKVQRKRSKRG